MSLRLEMPLTTAWIDSLRDAFGRDAIDGQIRAAVKDGRKTFYARENGHEVGTPLPAARVEIGADRMVIIPKEKDETRR